MVRKKNIKIVIGANYGDEGKGRMVDYFTRKEHERKQEVLVVCSNGGAQRGHTVVNDNNFSHVFHHFGSGTLAGADTYLPKQFIVNPMIFMKEYKEIGAFAPTVIINPECLVSTPFDMMNNQIIEESRGDRKHGSCGVGIWETILRKGKTYQEMISMSDEQLFNYLRSVRNQYSTKRLLKKSITMSDEWRKIYYNDNMIHHYIRDLRIMSSDKLGITKIANDDILRYYDSIIFENGQGLLLDQSVEELYSTPSNTTVSSPVNTINNAFGGTSYIDDLNIEACYVTRSYLTRHCLGEFREQEDIDKLGFDLNLNSESNINNKHQGTFRYGKLDLINILMRAATDFNKLHNINHIDLYYSIAITHMDENEINLDNLLSMKHKLNDFPKYLYKVYGPNSDDKVVVEDPYEYNCEVKYSNNNRTIDINIHGEKFKFDSSNNY